MTIHIYVSYDSDGGHASAKTEQGIEISASASSRETALAKLLNRIGREGYRGEAYLITGDEYALAGINHHGIV